MYKKNDVLNLKIVDITNDGEGVGKVDGFTFFVKDALIGDDATVKVTKIKKTYGYARLEKLNQASPFRIEPKCSISRQCGGCQIQAMDYRHQLEFKENKVKNNLIRLGGFNQDDLDNIFEPIIGMQDDVLDANLGCGFRYRNKAQYPISYSKDGRIIAGFYAGRTHSVIEVEDCFLGVPENKKILDAIILWMNQNNIKPYDEVAHKGTVRHVLIRKGFKTNQLMVCLVINAKNLPKQDELIKNILGISDEKDNITSISYSSNVEKTNVIMGDNYTTIYGSDTIEDYIGNLKFNISPLSFYQVNPVQTFKLYSTALEYANLCGGETVWDLYCGIGTISLFLAQKAGHVYGVEIIPEAIQDAKNNTKLNGLENTTFFVGKAEEVLPEFVSSSDNKEAKAPDVIVVDPPRKGCDEECLKTMVSMRPDRIVYVSCDSATLARDLRFLVNNGYELKRVRPCDMFSQTTHVETVVLMSKVK